MKIQLLKKLSVLWLLVIGTLCSFAQNAERVTITGTVLSAETKQPLSGASISVVGTKKGTITDSSGRFSIKVDKGQSLDINYVGFEKQSIRATKNESLTLTLQVRDVQNEEVVVIGYGTVRKSHLTGAVAKLKNENLDQIPVGRADLALQGKLAGVTIQQSDAQAGEAPTIQIRGATSITAGTNPLIVIDGYPVPTDLSAVDMADVESIEVLKDAASAAIYGSRGGNGVIIITTKSGKLGKTRASLNISTGVKNAYRHIDLPNLEDWALYVQLDNHGVLPSTVQQAMRYNAHTDAQDIIFHSGKFHDFQVSASGANNFVKFYLSGNAIIDDGIMIGNDNRRFGLKGNIEAKLSNKVSLGLNFTPSYSIVHNVPVTVQEAVRTLPDWMPVYHTDTSAFYTGKPLGSYASTRDFDPGRNPYYTGGVSLSAATTNNGLAQLAGTDDKRTQLRTITNVYLKWDINKDLSFKTSGGFFVSTTERNMFQKSWAQADPVLDGLAYARSTSRMILNTTKLYDLLNENILTYKKNIAKNSIDALAGFTAQYTKTDYQNSFASNYASDDLHTINAGSFPTSTGYSEDEGLLSYLLRVNYAYDNRYLLSVSGRTDGSSRFAENNRWAFFPSASLGWRISNEAFFPQTTFLSELKLRASYGATGNKNIGNYRYFANVGPAYAVLGNDATPGFQLQNFANEDLGWERTFSTNVGFDLGLFNNRVTLAADYYNTKTDRLLLDLPIEAATGFTSYSVNQGKVSTSGIEFELSARLVSKKNFTWDISGNGFTNKNQLIDFGSSQQQISQGDPKRANYFLTKVGQPLVQFYGYLADSAVTIKNTNYWPIGVTSLHTFVKDVNGDGKITDDDRVPLGSPYPKFSWGLTNNFRFGVLDVSLTLQGSHGGKVFNIDPYYFETQFSTTGSTAYQFQNFTSAQQDFLRLKSETDVFIQDASFIALRNLNIGYALNNKVVKSWGFSKIRLYASASNLWYKFASNYTSFNPEANNAFPNDPLRNGYQRGAVPITRTVTFGLNLDF